MESLPGSRELPWVEAWTADLRGCEPAYDREVPGHHVVVARAGDKVDVASRFGVFGGSVSDGCFGVVR